MAYEAYLNAKPYIFVGQKPEAVIINGERIPTKTWRLVYKEVLQDCIKDPARYELLMSLRGRIAGQQRVFIASSPNGMTRPLEVCEGLYAETHYGSETLMHILTIRVLKPLGYDYSKIKIVIKSEVLSMTRKEIWAAINSDKTSNFLFNLYGRWQDEKEYEDIADYLAAIQKSIPQAYAITQKPFGIKCKGSDGNLHAFIKRNGNEIQLFVKNIK
jgi:hypothetical protein